MEWGYTLAGLFLGIILGMTSVGGGSITTPVLIFGFSIQPAIAVGTALLYSAITKSGGIWAYWRHGVIHWIVVKRLVIGSVPAAFIVLYFLHKTGMSEGQHSELITVALGIALILTSSALLLQGTITKFLHARTKYLATSELYRVRQDEDGKAVATIAVGVFLGVMVTISSVGAGALGAVILLFLYPQMKGVEIVATTIAYSVPLTAIAGLGYATVGTVDWSLLAFLLIGSLPGIYIGSHLGVKIPDAVMRPLLAVLLFAVGVRCLL